MKRLVDKHIFPKWKQLQSLNDLVIELLAKNKSLEKENEFLKQLLMKPKNE